jgi:hypothetical protein
MKKEKMYDLGVFGKWSESSLKASSYDGVVHLDSPLNIVMKNKEPKALDLSEFVTIFGNLKFKRSLYFSAAENFNRAVNKIILYNSDWVRYEEAENLVDEAFKDIEKRKRK